MIAQATDTTETQLAMLLANILRDARVPGWFGRVTLDISIIDGEVETVNETKQRTHKPKKLLRGSAIQKTTQGL